MFRSWGTIGLSIFIKIEGGRGFSWATSRGITHRLVDKEECIFCPDIRETNEHAFWQCHQTKRFWTQFKSLFGITGELDLKTIITGIYRQRERISPNVIALCILLAKKYLWRARKASQSPDTRGFIPVVTGYIRVERYMAVLEGKEKERRVLSVLIVDSRRCGRGRAARLERRGGAP